jgi:hypothetical protein
VGINTNVAVGRANIQIVHYFEHGYLEEEKLMIQSFTVTFGAKYLTGIWLYRRIMNIKQMI